MVDLTRFRWMRELPMARRDVFEDPVVKFNPLDEISFTSAAVRFNG